MYPTLLHIGPLTIYSFGLMVAIAFLTANSLLNAELKRKAYPNAEQLGSSITLLALLGGIFGAKLFHLLENPSYFFEDPIGSLFSGEGLTFYGGLITSIVMILVYLRTKQTPFLGIADAASPSLMIAYGIGRIGCQLAGDGDYGIPTDHAFGMSYPDGMVSTLSARNTELVRYFQELFPGRPIPEDIIVHPTPVYETLIAFLFFGILWRFRTKQLGMGQLFGMYLILAGIERFLIEFLRMNPLYMGLSQAQWISITLGMIGSIIFIRNKNH